MSDLIAKLRNPAFAPNDNRRTILHTPQVMADMEAAAAEIERLKAERLKLDRRIHNQRKSLRDNWEIVEMRRKWMGHPVAFKRYNALLDRHRELLARVRDEHRREKEK